MKNTNFQGNSKLVDAIDYRKLLEKANEYSFGSLISDISWFVHNCHIVHTRKADLHKAADSLMDYVQNEITLIQICMGCFESLCSRKNGMIQKCGKEHPLVWAQSTGHSYWPAKVLKINDDSTRIVWYFGDYDMDTIPANLCVSFDEKCPDDGCDAPLYQAANEVC